VARVPVRATLAFAGAGSLGTFLSAASREVICAIRAHNMAIVEGASNDDPRYMHSRWGKIIVDSLGGSSAGALCATQIVKALYHPEYLGDGEDLGASATLSGDWVRGGDFARLAVVGETPSQAGPIEAPGWTLISGARLYDLAAGALCKTGEPDLDDPASPIDPSGTVAVAITLTDLLGYHAPAEFGPDEVLGHPSFGLPRIARSKQVGQRSREIRDLGGRGHAEVRKLFVAATPHGVSEIREFLGDSSRRGRARAVEWGNGAEERLAALTAASAALPLAVGPLAMTDKAADSEGTVRRLYMDGGILNNKPVAPALKLARWYDGVRLARHELGEHGYTQDDVENELVYERVCFFFDAFPDRTRDDWRSDHPDAALNQTGSFELTPDAILARDKRIDRALEVPTAAIDVFFESMLTSLRAQDILGIAKTNARLTARDEYIRQRARSVSRKPSTFKIDTVEKAEALAAVRQTDVGAALNPLQARKVAHRIWESDGFSGLSGRRPVTMVPVFAPENLKAVFAGEGLYAVGGLLDLDARLHDATVGRDVAKHVIAGLRDPDASTDVKLSDAPEESLPTDTTALVERLWVSSMSVINAIGNRPHPLRFLAKLPLRLRPLRAVAKRRLDHVVRSPGLTPTSIVEEDDE
jgi:predicted acylesterase/phospholipase RssA